MTRKKLYQTVCRQYGLHLIFGLFRWKVVDPSGAVLTPAASPVSVRRFIDGYVEAMQRARAGHDAEPLAL